MRTKIAIQCIMLLLFIGLPIELFAFQKESKNQEGTPVDSPFDITVNKLPANFQGNDISNLFNTLNKIIPAKDEFETTAQYAARLKATIGGEVYAFKIQAQYVIYTKYAADDEIITITIKTHQNRNFGYSPAPGTDSLKDFDSHLLRGVTIKSDLAEINEESVAISNLPHSSHNPLILELTISIPMKSDVARQLKPNLAALLICKLKNVSTSESLTFWVPEKTSDGKLKLHKYINVELEAIWIYDTSTGQILKKDPMKK